MFARVPIHSTAIGTVRLQRQRSERAYVRHERLRTVRMDWKPEKQRANGHGRDEVVRT